jgi:hypothetical protein
MTGNGRNLTLVQPVPAPEDDGIAWVPVLEVTWRDDRRDLIQTETEKAS